MPITSTLRHILDFYLHCFISFTVPQRLISQTLSFCLLNYPPCPSWFDFKLRFYVTKFFFFPPLAPPPPHLCFMILMLQPLYIGIMCSLECLLCLRSKCAEVQPQSAQITVDCQVWFAASNLLWRSRAGAVRRVFFMVNPWQHTLIITLNRFPGKKETLHRASAILHGLCWRQTQKREQTKKIIITRLGSSSQLAIGARVTALWLAVMCSEVQQKQPSDSFLVVLLRRKYHPVVIRLPPRQHPH